MNISIIAVGTRGDVEPHMALAARLASRGHRVTLAAPIDFEAPTRALGLTFHAINVGFRNIYSTPEGAALLTCDAKSVEFIRRLARLAVPLVGQVIADIRAACAGADVVYYSILGLPAHYIAKELGIPAVATSLQPMGRTTAFPSPLYSFGLRLPGPLNLLTHRIVEQAFWQLYRPLMKRAAISGLPRWGHFNEIYRGRSPMLLAFSPSVVRRPADYAPWMHTTGFWRLPLDRGWTPPTSLTEFLAAGPPPVCVGFGSMNSHRIDTMLPVVLRAIAAAGRRAIVLTGWWEEQLGDELLGRDVYVTEAVPHAWLFPSVSAVVHHGGAGTTAAAVEAGVPSIIAPFFFDQWFWGRSLHRQGLGPEPIAGSRISIETVRRALNDIEHTPGFRQRLGTLSRALQDEDGVGNAVSVIENTLHTRAPVAASVAE